MKPLPTTHQPLTTTFPPRPRVGAHPILGPRRTWTARDGRARIDRFGNGSRLYLAQVRDRLGWRIVAACRKLKTARQRAAAAATKAAERT